MGKATLQQSPWGQGQSAEDCLLCFPCGWPPQPRLAPQQTATPANIATKVPSAPYTPLCIITLELSSQPLPLPHWAGKGEPLSSVQMGTTMHTEPSYQALRLHCSSADATENRNPKLGSRVRLLAIPWTAPFQAPPSMGFSRQEYWTQEGCQGPSRPSGRNRGLPLRRRRGQGALLCLGFSSCGEWSAALWPLCTGLPIAVASLAVEHRILYHLSHQGSPRILE